MVLSATSTASEDGFNVSVETPYEGMSAWQWVPRVVLRALGLSVLGLLMCVSPGPSAVVVVRRNRSVYRRFPADDLNAAAALAATIAVELETQTAEEFLRSRSAIRRW